MIILPSAKKASAIIVAGGDSKRLGFPKPLLKFGDKTIVQTMIERLAGFFNEIIVVTDREELFSGLPVKITGDLITGGKKCSLKGIHAGLACSSCRNNFVIACDMPFVNMHLIKYMSSFTPHYGAVVPRIQTYVQPLYAYYSKDCLPVMGDNLVKGQFKISGIYPEIKVKYIEEEEIDRHDPLRRAFFNINTPEDYEEAARIVAENNYPEQPPGWGQVYKQ